MCVCVSLGEYSFACVAQQRCEDFVGIEGVSAYAFECVLPANEIYYHVST